MSQSFYARGKILLTSEFIILHGAKALALPLKLGQHLHPREKKKKGTLHWEASHDSSTWLEVKINLESMQVSESSDTEKGETLVRMFHKLIDINPAFRNELEIYDVHTELEFNPNFGFGSSSTLTSLLAQWANVDPMQFHFSISRGSGYDVACASAESAILYEIIDEMPVTEAIDYNPPFADQLWLIYLGEKQNSSKSVAAFLENYTPNPDDISYFSRLSCSILNAGSLEEFGQLLEEHEERISSILGIPGVKGERFPDLDGYAKSLGAWGGDFVLIVTPWNKEELISYLVNKGITHWFPFNEITL